ncbi:MAG: hypothetical protein ACYSX0_09650 [Planctomycetota bacterium]
MVPPKVCAGEAPPARAYRDRIFRTPPPIRIVTKVLHCAFPALVDLCRKLSAG